MSINFEQFYCTVCDHGVIDGVACDGKPEECPFNAMSTVGSARAGRRCNRVRPIDCAQPDEPDFVRAED